MNTLAEKLVDAWKKRDLIKINSEEPRSDPEPTPAVRRSNAGRLDADSKKI